MFTQSLFVISTFVVFLFLSCDNRSTFDQAKPNPAPDNSSQTFSFTDVTIDAGLGNFRYFNGAVGNMWFPEQMGPGCGFMDYDGDGWLDILLIAGGYFPGQEKEHIPALSLYRNLGNGTFAAVTQEAGLQGVSAYGLGVATADYDNDGDQDIYFTTLRRNMFFQNNNAVFSEIGDQAGVVSQQVWSGAANFFDADRDGWLDLYVGNYAKWSPETDIRCEIEGGKKVYCPPGQYTGIPSRYYHSNGDGTFTDATIAAGFSEDVPGKSLGTVELDYNRDGWPDLIVANDGEGDLLYHNRGDGTFSEKGMISGMAYGERGEARAGMGIDVGVIDASGYESIVIGHFEKEMIGVFKNIGNGLFVSRSAVSKIGQSSLRSLTFGILLFDADLDGDLDLFAANGHVYILRLDPSGDVSYRQKSQLFLNRGDGIFDEVSPEVAGALQQEMVARGVACGDYDLDGDLDLLIIENGEKFGPVHLWRNDLRNGRFLRIRLQGTKSNRDAIGARIVAIADTLTMERRIRSSNSYLSQSERVAAFGLGSSDKVDSLTVYWPSGRIDHFQEIEANQQILLIEGHETYDVESVRSVPKLAEQ